MSQPEARAWSPLWLEYSGLPKLLAEKTRGPAGWLLFKKIAELDCDRNSMPGTIEISLQELEVRCGIDPAEIRKTAEVLRKQKLIATFLPDNDEEAALFRIAVPLQTPVSPAEIRTAQPHLFEQAAQRFRYFDDCTPAADGDTDLPTADPKLKTVVDLYFDVVGMKMNVFILDELRMVAERFPMHDIESTFSRARKNEIRSLRWVIQELVRRRKKAEDAPAPAQTPLFAGNDDDRINF